MLSRLLISHVKETTLTKLKIESAFEENNLFAFNF